MCACKNRHRFSREQAFERVRHRMASGPAGCAASVPPSRGLVALARGPAARLRVGLRGLRGALVRRQGFLQRRDPRGQPARRSPFFLCAAASVLRKKPTSCLRMKSGLMSFQRTVVGCIRIMMSKKKRNSVLEVTGLGLRHQRKRPSSVVDHPQLDEISLFLHFTF